MFQSMQNHSLLRNLWSWVIFVCVNQISYGLHRLYLSSSTVEKCSPPKTALETIQDMWLLTWCCTCLHNLPWHSFYTDNYMKFCIWSISNVIVCFMWSWVSTADGLQTSLAMPFHRLPCASKAAYTLLLLAAISLSVIFLWHSDYCEMAVVLFACIATFFGAFTAAVWAVSKNHDDVVFHPHHWYIGMVFVALTTSCMHTHLSFLLQGVSLGVMINGISTYRWQLHNFCT